MKRKRGHKKGKSKGPPKAVKIEATPVVSVNNTEDDSNNGGEYGNDEGESTMEVDTPSSTGTDQPLNVASINPDGSVDKSLGKPVGRVKVKLKTPKMLESSHSDTDKSNSQLGGERLEDSAISLAEMKMSVLWSATKKAGSIKIKSSRGLGSSFVGKTSDGVTAQAESICEKKLNTPRMDHQYNKEELDAALMVIKKVMKMDAAEPFNAPVNPEALGIPDYFDVIDTPMDFGTICSNLENGSKYMNSEDVYKDVEYIWENCNKYNSKGDYILDLMRRVKKNFMKLWMAAGLYVEQSSGSAGTQDIAQSSQGKAHMKGGQQKQKLGKRHGRRHKHDCLCAICVLKRRKREREENARIAKGQIGGVEAQELNQEESSHVESPHGDDSSSDMGESQDLDADAEEGKREDVKMESAKQHYSHMDGKHKEEEDKEEDDEEDENEEEEEEGGEENEMDMQKKGEDETPKQSKSGERLEDSLMRRSEPGMPEKSGGMQTPPREIDAETAAVHKQAHKKPLEWAEKAKMCSNLSSENPMLLKLCGVLFPEDHHISVWNGPHSLVQRRHVSAHTNSIRAAIESLMK